MWPTTGDGGEDETNLRVTEERIFCTGSKCKLASADSYIWRGDLDNMKNLRSLNMRYVMYIIYGSRNTLESSAASKAYGSTRCRSSTCKLLVFVCSNNQFGQEEENLELVAALTKLEGLHSLNLR